MALIDTNNNAIDKSEQYLRELTRTFTGIQKPLNNAKIPKTLNDLITELHQVFSSDCVNIEYVNHLLLSYKSNPADWKKFAKFDRFKYTRNLIDAGNGKFNLMLICWGEGHASAIHDHADSHCFMKMLKGELCEIRYAWPSETNQSTSTEVNANANASQQPQTESNAYDGSELQELGRTKMETNSVHYINDTLGLHRVENISHTDSAISMHLYCPPYNSCSIFNEKTGKQTKCNVEFYSLYGKRKNKGSIPEVVSEEN